MPKVTLNWEGKLVAGRYLVQKRLGEGGMGTVYLALDQQQNNTPVVLKTPRIALLEDPQFFKRFEREMRAMQQLRHPHLVPLLDLGEHNRIPFIVMKYLPGGSLQERLRKGRAQGWADLSPWLEPIAAALDYLHSQKVVHRDVKPNNVLFDERGVAYLTDLGAVKVQEGSELSGKTKLTQTGFSLGTPGYMAPEVLFGKAYDGRADQYALAAMVYEALSGQVPYAADSIPALIEQLVRGGEAERLDRLCGVPVGVADAVARALARQPEQRYATCREFVQAVRVGFTAPPCADASDTMSTLVAPGGAMPSEPRVTPVRVAPVGANPVKAQPPSPGVPGAVVQPVASTPPPHQLPPAPQVQPASPALAPTLPAEVMPPPPPVSSAERRGSSDQPRNAAAVLLHPRTGNGDVAAFLWVLTVAAIIVAIWVWYRNGAIPPWAPTTWRVDFVSLDLPEAVSKAASGDTIEIPSGRHILRESLTIHKPLIIRGAGRDKSHLLFQQEDCAISFRGSGPWILEGLTIEHVGEAAASVVRVHGGHVILRQCRFSGAVFEEKGEERRGGCGIVFWGNARGLVFECVCDGNGLHGIQLGGNAQPILEGNTCENNKQSGIVYFENAGGTARNNTCRGNGYHGIGVQGQAQPVLEGNTCENSKYSGIAYFEKASGTARNNTCRGNGYHGISVSGQAQPLLDRNICEKNEGNGIAYFNKAAGTSRGNICRENDANGIVILAEACPLLEANTCEKNWGCGIAYDDRASGTARKNTCRRNRRHGIAVKAREVAGFLVLARDERPEDRQKIEDDLKPPTASAQTSPTSAEKTDNQPTPADGNEKGVPNDAQPVVEGNTCESNSQCGIVYGDNAGGTARNNTCRHNGSHGISVGDNACPLIEGNTCEGNGQWGILYGQNACGTVRENTCRENDLDGIAISGEARPQVEGNHCEGNKQCGIHYGQGAGGSARNNTCCINGADGIALSGQAQPVLEGNTSERNEGSGINYRDRAAGSASKNICRDNNQYGIVIAKGANPKLEDNQLSGNKEGDLYREQ